MKYFLIKAFVLFFLVFIGCGRNKINEIETVKPYDYINEYYFVNLSDWKVVQMIEDVTLEFDSITYFGGYYHFNRKVLDTIFWIKVEYYESKKDTLFIPRLFYKRYTDLLRQYVILFGNEKDTLFHYSADLFGSLHKNFISGKYYYQYKFGELNHNQRVFFEQHKDSLTKIKGNNLPKLPELMSDKDSKEKKEK